MPHFPSIPPRAAPRGRSLVARAPRNSSDRSILSPLSSELTSSLLFCHNSLPAARAYRPLRGNVACWAFFFFFFFLTDLNRYCLRTAWQMCRWRTEGWVLIIYTRVSFHVCRKRHSETQRSRSRPLRFRGDGSIIVMDPLISPGNKSSGEKAAAVKAQRVPWCNAPVSGKLFPPPRGARTPSCGGARPWPHAWLREKRRRWSPIPRSVWGAPRRPRPLPRSKSCRRHNAAAAPANRQTDRRRAVSVTSLGSCERHYINASYHYYYYYLMKKTTQQVYYWWITVTEKPKQLSSMSPNNAITEFTASGVTTCRLTLSGFLRLLSTGKL